MLLLSNGVVVACDLNGCFGSRVGCYDEGKTTTFDFCVVSFILEKRWNKAFTMCEKKNYVYSDSASLRYVFYIVSSRVCDCERLF